MHHMMIKTTATFERYVAGSSSDFYLTYSWLVLGAFIFVCEHLVSRARDGHSGARRGTAHGKESSWVDR
jgi:hypothetical protein